MSKAINNVNKCEIDFLNIFFFLNYRLFKFSKALISSNLTETRNNLRYILSLNGFLI